MKRHKRAAPDPARRAFLRGGGLTAAGLVIGGAAGAAVGHQAGIAEAEQPLPRGARSAPGFDHVVVLMGENRSFDNLLGWLYTPDNLPDGQTFDGLAFGDHSNPDADGNPVSAFVYSGSTDVIMESPDPDPGEEYPHVNTQLFGTVDPPDNAKLWVDQMRPPFNAPPQGAKATMDGFVKDYTINLERLHKGKKPTADQVAQIMGSFSPEQLPVLSTLAREFAVFDAWFSAVPSQTYCNRSFFAASTSNGFVTNEGGRGYDKWLDAPASPTIFNRLEEAGISWKVYFDPAQLVSLTGVINAPALEKYWKTNHFVHMSDFWDDCANGTLPAYAFIEPRLVYNHNDFHPPVGALRESDVDGEEVADSAVSDVRAGEALVASVYDAIRTSATEDGSNAYNTLLLITFDEHGGTYDHVAPPVAAPPEVGAPEGEMGFRFDRLGLRVPAIAVSAYTDPGTIIHDEMHHGSVIATLCELHELPPLTRRDESANDLFSIVNRAQPRDAATWPTVQPMYVPANPQADDSVDPTDNAHKDKPLSPPGRGLVGMLMRRDGDDDPVPTTYAEAHKELQKHGLGLFYPKSE